MAQADGPVTEAHVLAIGRVVVRWGMTERVIMDSLWEVATGQSFENMPEEASISLALVTGMEARVALGILKAAFRARHANAADEFDKIVDKIDKLRDTRNLVAHARWLKGKRAGTISTAVFKSSGRLRAVEHAFTAPELEALAERITAATGQLMAFLSQRRYWKTSPRTEQEGKPIP